jgi:hypothetical protein
LALVTLLEENKTIFGVGQNSLLFKICNLGQQIN